MRRDLKALPSHGLPAISPFKRAPADAMTHWDEAIGDACLAERHADAADWLYSQRFVASRYGGILEDHGIRWLRALSDLPFCDPSIVTIANDCRERALAAMHFEEPKSHRSTCAGISSTDQVCVLLRRT